MEKIIQITEVVQFKQKPILFALTDGGKIYLLEYKGEKQIWKELELPKKLKGELK